MAKSKLSEEHKAFVVQALACFDTPKTVADALRKEFGVVLTPQSIEAYDPTKRAGRRASEKWKQLFAATRKAFLEDTAEIAISHRPVRLRALQRMAAAAEDQRNLALAASLLEQAAKEVGDAYTNRRELTGKNGTPLPAAAQITVYQLPDNGRG